MQFTIVTPTGPDTSNLPHHLSPINTRIDATQVTKIRRLTLTEVEDPAADSPVIGLIDNTCWEKPTTETPELGTTEIWEIVNMTDDTHPIHIHLVQFNLLNRQLYDKDAYTAAYNTRNGGGGLPGPNPYCPPPASPGANTTIPPQPLSVDPFLKEHPIPSSAPEAGFKVVVRVKGGTVTRLLIKFAPQDPAAGDKFAFDATVGQYVWHCHLLEHEDNDMMRPMKMTHKDHDHDHHR